MDDATEEAAAAVGAWSQFASTPRVFRPLGAAIEDFATDSLANNFLKDAKWSPDGLCLLASADDNAIRLFEPGTAAPDAAQLQEEWDLPQHDRLRASLKVQEGETIYDMAWLPTMASSDPASCCFFSTSRDNPVHIWDAFTGRCRGSYCAYTDAEELTAGYCIAFSTHAASEQLYVGFNNCVRVFDLSRPGREHRVIPTFKRANRETTGQRGIISCIAFNPDKSGLYACGSYSRNVGLYAAPKGNLLYNLQGQRGGITQVLWSRDGNYLFVGGRKDREILCWDVRNTGTASQLERSAVHCVPCREYQPSAVDGLIEHWLMWQVIYCCLCHGWCQQISGCSLTWTTQGAISSPRATQQHVRLPARNPHTRFCLKPVPTSIMPHLRTMDKRRGACFVSSICGRLVRRWWEKWCVLVSGLVGSLSIQPCRSWQLAWELVSLMCHRMWRVKESSPRVSVASACALLPLLTRQARSKL